ncbi:glycosyltransferase family 2 protein [Sphingobacterium lactis]|uniref:N-terminal domain of galactosyltransferase n=1 Tax=Sphingobacterium lactis TaxID=797291 RepID=A0A1H6C9U8_9SPHI|nr:glycosyltransferase family 2 protein [Sphingobacterium lactis]SEG69740.1 N-terminal domain of galactosyltransferase [Sphingobacterium lactis]
MNKLDQDSSIDKCTLLVSTYNWPEALELCLESIANQTVIPTEVIIADDGSKDATKAIIEKYNGQLAIKHVWHPDEGFRKCIILNKALHEASTPYIVQIDGDVILDRNFIKDHLQVAEKGCFIRGTRSHIEEDFLPYLFKHKKVDFNFLSKGVKHRFNALRLPMLAGLMIKKKSNSYSVRGCNMGYWLDDFINVNGYNNDLQGWGHEDEELAARFVNMGILKKSVKLRCIQYHIFHPLAARSQENTHEKTIDIVRADGIQRTENGYLQALEEKNA